MKCVLLFLAVVAATAYAMPPSHDKPGVESENSYDGGHHGMILHEAHSRMRRATCDGCSFESIWFTPHDACCAAHCLILGHKGGHCVGTICHCRN